MPTKILYIHNGADLYGASRYLLWLVQGLDRSRFEPVVILPHKGPLLDVLRSQKVEFVTSRLLGIISRSIFYSWRIVPFMLILPLSACSLAVFIRRSNIGLVHTNTGVIVAAGFAARLAGVPHIWHIHDSFHEFGRLWAWYSRYVLWSSSRVVCVSRSVASQFHEQLEKVVVIYNGLPEDEFGSVPEDQLRSFKLRFGLKNERTIGVVGRIKLQRKGQEVFAKAIGILKKKIKEVKYLIVGSPFPGNEHHLAKLQSLIHELGLGDDVVFTGDVSDMRLVYQALDVLVVPSSFPEPFGLVILEAMATGVPVIATNIGAPPELIEDGVSGILVEPDDPRMLADKMELLLSDDSLYHRIQGEARKRFVQRFRLQPMISQVEELYARVLSAKD